MFSGLPGTTEEADVLDRVRAPAVNPGRAEGPSPSGCRDAQNVTPTGIFDALVRPDEAGERQTTFSQERHGWAARQHSIANVAVGEEHAFCPNPSTV